MNRMKTSLYGYRKKDVMKLIEQLKSEHNHEKQILNDQLQQLLKGKKGDHPDEPA